MAHIRHPVGNAWRGPRTALFFVLVLVLGAAGSLGAYAADAIGSVTYLEGSVSMVRDGTDIPDVQIGQDVQAFDVVKTADDGVAEISLTAPQLPRMTIKLSADTQFALEVATTGDGKLQSTVSLLGGQVALKVAKLLGNQSVRVQTESAAMGVRGTEFSVTAVSTGDVLVDCDEGAVAVTDDQGRELSAAPGSVVEQRPGEAYQTVPVAPAGLEQFRAQWREQRRQFLEANALRFIRVNAALYRQLSREFTALHQELARNQSIVNKWAFEDRAGQVGSRVEVLRERRLLGAQLVRLRRTAFRLERVAFRLERLQALHDRGIGAGSLEDGTTTAVFFAQVARERQDVRRKLALTRYLTKQFLRRNEGHLPE